MGRLWPDYSTLPKLSLRRKSQRRFSLSIDFLMSTDLDDDDVELEDEIQVRQVFAYFGRAMYAASCVEHGLTIALMQADFMSKVVGRARREKKGPTRTQWEAMFDDYMAKHDKVGLGTLVARFRSVLKVEPALDALLDETVSRRNHLAHAFFREKAVEFAHSVGRDRMIIELEADHDLFTRTDRAVQAAVAHILPKLGIDPQAHQAQTEAITKSLLDEARAKAAAD